MESLVLMEWHTNYYRHQHHGRHSLTVHYSAKWISKLDAKPGGAVVGGFRDCISSNIWQADIKQHFS